jgi:signal transduction histidine kinase
MFRGLKIAVRKQKRLILVFLFTIFIPAVTLSIFGLIALHNERYRLEKEFRETQLDHMDLIKSEVNREIGMLENDLHILVRTPSFTNMDYPEILKLVEDHQEAHPLSGQFIVEYKGSEPWFPPFLGEGSGYIPGRKRDFTRDQKGKLEQAENLEFTQNDPRAAISLLEEILKATKDQELRAQLLNFIARNYLKLNDLNNAITIYSLIIRGFPGNRTSSGIPLSITARLQLVACYLRSGLPEKALDESFAAYEETFGNFYILGENQFVAYASMAREQCSNILEGYQGIFPDDTACEKALEDLEIIYREKIHEWQVVQNLKEECVPELSMELHLEGNYSEEIRRYTKRIGTEDYLIISLRIPDEAGIGALGFAGIKINNHFLEDSLVAGIIKNSGLNADGSLVVTDLNGRQVFGDQTASADASTITSYFDGNFPPWRIEVSSNRTSSFLFAGIFKSYYFWTILVMIAILVFGMVITGRIIEHERELLKLKSGFVSSVSHEFKTPITSIKALTERLLEDTVIDPERMRDYHSVISRDAEHLNHLVGNILDFSAMEEGKKQYHFEETDFRQWLEDTINDFFSRTPDRKFTFRNTGTGSRIPVRMDTDDMKLAINNLLDNAVKFSSEDSEITVILEKQDKHLLLKVIDEGIGIPRKEQERIFEKFYRVQPASDHSVTGTGLGLTLVKQIVEAHGGEVLVDSEPGKGTIMNILLPVVTSSEG